MRIRFFTDKTEAAKMYKVQASSGNKAILIGPDEFVVAPGPDDKSFVFDPPGTGNVFVLITGATDTIASFKVPEVPA